MIGPLVSWIAYRILIVLLVLAYLIGRKKLRQQYKRRRSSTVMPKEIRFYLTAGQITGFSDRSYGEFRRGCGPVECLDAPALIPVGSFRAVPFLDNLIVNAEFVLRGEQ